MKLFRKSPVKNEDFLQPYIVESEGREYTLLLDCKTRWNSLLAMLERFYKLQKEIKLAVLRLDKDFDISNGDLEYIEEII